MQGHPCNDITRKAAMRTWNLLAFFLMVTSPDQDTTIMGDNDNKALQCSEIVQKWHFRSFEKLSSSMKVIKIIGPICSKYSITYKEYVVFLS